MTSRLVVLALAVLTSAVSCARASSEPRHGGRTAGEWVAALADDDAWLSAGDREARGVLAALVAKLGAMIESADAEAAGDAGRLLGSIGEPARGTLMTKLAHPRPEVRIRAILELDSLKTGVLPALAKAADDPEGQVRAAAVTVLGVLALWDAPDSAAGIPIIKSKLKDPDPAVRDAATRALKNAAAH